MFDVDSAPFDVGWKPREKILIRVASTGLKQLCAGYVLGRIGYVALLNELSAREPPACQEAAIAFAEAARIYLCSDKRQHHIVSRCWTALDHAVFALGSAPQSTVRITVELSGARAVV